MAPAVCNDGLQNLTRSRELGPFAVAPNLPPAPVSLRAPLRTVNRYENRCAAQTTHHRRAGLGAFGQRLKDRSRRSGWNCDLSGHVDSYTEKVHAERAAQRVPGVKALAVEMEGKLPGSDQRTDADIARSAENVLEWNSCLPNSVKVKAEKGKITLSGEVEWNYQRKGASDAVRYLTGVTGVSDEIAIKPRASVSAVKSDIEAALKRHAQAEAQHITVDV